MLTLNIKLLFLWEPRMSEMSRCNEASLHFAPGVIITQWGQHQNLQECKKQPPAPLPQFWCLYGDH